MEIDIIYDNFNKTYNKGTNITGSVLISSNERQTEFSQLSLTLVGSYTIKNTKVSPPTVSVIKFFSKKIKIAENGKITLGNNNVFQFKFPLIEDSKDHQIFETYQGVLITIGYEMRAELETHYRGTILSDNKKVNVFVPSQGIKDDYKKKIIPYEFEVTPQTLERIKINQTKVPNFKICCRVDNTNCDLNAAFDGSVTVQESEIAIKSLELQFVRNESIVLAGGETISEISEIQNLQIGDGDVNKNVEIPLFMIFPRFFACATVETKIAKVTFEMNLIVVLVNGLVITENFPINTWRS